MDGGPACRDDVDPAAVAAYMRDVAGATPGGLAHYACSLEALVRHVQQTPGRYVVSLATLEECLRQVRALLSAEP